MNYQKSIKLITVILFLLLGKSNYLYAQFQDSLNYKSPNHFPWENPLSIQENNFNIKTPALLVPSIEYDPILSRYVITQNIGSYNISNPSYLTMDEFITYKNQQSLKDYWKKKEY